MAEGRNLEMREEVVQEVSPMVRKIEVNLNRISCDGRPCPDPKIREGRFGMTVTPLPFFDKRPASAYRP